MQLVFERDENKMWVAKVYWPVSENQAVMVKAVAEGSQHLDNDPYEIFGDVLKRFPKTTEELNHIGQHWSDLLQTAYVVAPPQTAQFMEDFDPYKEVTLTQVAIKFDYPRHVKINSLMWQLENSGKFKGQSTNKVEYGEIKYTGNKGKPYNSGANEVLGQLDKYFDMEQRLKCHKDCPDGQETVTLSTYVWHLNDKQGWTISKIAEHLEELPINIQMKENAVTA